MNGFELSVGRPGAPLHAAAHSHHPWPDVSLQAQELAWHDAARLLDRKWDHIFSTIIPAAQAHVARQLSLPDPTTIAFGPNTHGFVQRILSCLPSEKPPRILTTDSEFMSFARQIARLEEEGLASVTRIATEPYRSLDERFAHAAAEGEHDLVFFSHVFFNSGFAVHDLGAIVRAVRDSGTLIVIDGYHGFMAIPTDLSAIAPRAFYLAGGYKYAMAGEGACFLHCPPGFAPRPRDTGWYAGFSALESGRGRVAYAEDGSRFLGATFDVSALYRFIAVQDWLKLGGKTVPAMLAHVRALERTFLSELDQVHARLDSSMLVVPDTSRRGRFLAFRTEQAGAIAEALAARNFIVDFRGDRLRAGFGIYHDADAAVRLAQALA
jgi:selenocysteine lyase/cysteine desulfurase